MEERKKMFREMLVFNQLKPQEENRTKEDEDRTKKKEDRTKEENVNFNNYNFTTDFKEEKFSITWHIQNTHRCMLKRGEFLESSTFSTRFCGEVKWTLRLYPKGRKFERPSGEKSFRLIKPFTFCRCKESVSLFLNRISMHTVTSYFRYRFTFVTLSSNGQEIKKIHYPSAAGGVAEMDINSLQPYNSSEYGADAIFCYCRESEEKSQAFLVTCDIFVSNIFKMGSPNNYTCTAGLSKSGTLFHDLKEMYETGRFSDVTLQAGDVKFPTHKAMLASRSRVFDAMFQHDMKESQTSVLKVDDIEPDVLRDMLQYIYTGSINDFDVEKAMSLYYVSGKYSLDELKNWCVDIMLAMMTVENVCQIALLADMHPDPKLKDAAFHFFRNNTSDIFKSKKWQELVENANCHALVTEILKAVSTSFVTNCDE